MDFDVDGVHEFMAKISSKVVHAMSFALFKVFLVLNPFEIG